MAAGTNALNVVTGQDNCADNTGYRKVYVMDGLQLQSDGELPIEALDLTVIEKPKNRALNPAPIPLWDRPYLDGGYKRVMMYLDCTQDGWNYAVLAYFTKGYGEYLQNMVTTLKGGPFTTFELAQEAGIERYYQLIVQQKEKAKIKAEKSREWDRKWGWSGYTAILLFLGAFIGFILVVFNGIDEQINHSQRYVGDQGAMLIVTIWILCSFALGIGIWKHDQRRESEGG